MKRTEQVIRIEISNMIRVRGKPSKKLNVLMDRLVKLLTLTNPKFEEAKQHGRSTYGIKPVLYNYEILRDGIAIPRGCIKDLLTMLNDLGVEHEIVDSRTKFDPMQIDSRTIKYRSYQSQPVKDLIGGGDEGVMVAPAGSGKTVMGLSLISLLGQPTLWLTHRDRLMKQTLARANVFLPSLTEEDKGVIGGGKKDIGKILTVGMIQTLANMSEKDLEEFRNLFGMLILDEAHHCPAQTFSDVIIQFSAYYIYGLTATPYRRDKLEKMMFQVLGPITAIVDRKKVEESGGIVTPTVKYRAIPYKRVNDNNVPRLLRNHIINNSSRNNIIVSDVIREALEGNFCIVLSDRKIHCEILYDLISVTFEKTGVATGKYAKKFIDEQVKRLEEEEITVLVCTPDLLSEGFDVDKLNRGFIAIPFRSATKTEQVVGRVQRPAKGKTDAIIYDYVDVDIGVLASQFFSKYREDCRYKTYEKLGCSIEPL